MTDEMFLSVENLQQHYPVRSGLFNRVVDRVRAVDGVSFSMRRGETLGLVGESGCGKTTVGRSILYLLPPTGGRVRFKGRDVGEAVREDAARVRREMQIIFQDPFGSLNPRMNIGDIIGEAPLYHGVVSRGEVGEYVAEIMGRVGLRPEARAKYPHEFSGGQRQRVCIARALAMRPEFVVCDEAVSALDVSIQSQVLNLLVDLRGEFGLTYLFISHDLSVVRHISDRVAVLYMGKLVELGPKGRFFAEPAHPYSRVLLSAIPVLDPDGERRRVVLRGEAPSPRHPPEGCIFSTRCPDVMERCRSGSPPMVDLGEGHEVACFLYCQ